MTFAEEIVTYLAAQGLGTKGTDLFVDFYAPGRAGTVTVVRSTGGLHAHAGLPWSQPSVQVMVRSEDYDTAASQAAKIHNLLHGMVKVDVTHHHILTSEAFGLPQSIGRDAQDRSEVSANYSFEMYALTDSGTVSTGYGGDKAPDSFA